MSVRACEAIIGARREAHMPDASRENPRFRPTIPEIETISPPPTMEDGSVHRDGVEAIRLETLWNQSIRKLRERLHFRRSSRALNGGLL